MGTIKEMKGKLNIPQRTVLLWDDIHPYNAVHVARIPRPLDTERLKHTLDSLLQSYGLTGLSIDRKKNRYHYHGGPAHTEIRVRDGHKDALSSLGTEVQDQLNTRFAQDTVAITPFRFFVVREEGSFYLGLVYYHLISGGDSIIYLLKDIVHCYLKEKTAIPRIPPDLYDRSYSCLPLFHPKNLIEWVTGLPGHIADMRQYYRPRYRDYNDHNVGFTCFSLGPDHYRLLLHRSRQWGVTVNDMFMALMLKSLSPIASKRSSEARRNKLSIASVVNIRRDLSVDNRKSFGMFLGSFNVSHILPDGISLEELVKDVHVQTVRIKKQKLYLQTILEEGLALFLVSFFYGKRRNSFYSKHHPVWGGLSNINLNKVWDQSEDREAVAYFRAVSTGPATPLVFSPTTVLDRLNIGVSFRTTVFSREAIEKIVSDFTKYITNL
jgi:NRPS condensation-like uncharacterized protein